MCSEEINNAVELLRNDQIISIPTETVYGLAGNVYSEKAIKQIFDLKKRPYFNPLIVHIHSINQLNNIAQDIPSKAMLLAETFWPGPLTLVLKKQEHISDLITAGKDTVAVRVPNNSVTIELLKKLDFPLAAPSANPFGSISPTKPEHVKRYFGENLKMVLNGGECEKGIESTIIGFENNEPILYRHGSISLEEIEKITGALTVNTFKKKSPNAPGMLAKHYAPKTKTILVDKLEDIISQYNSFKVGTLSLKKNFKNNSIHSQISLSKTGDLNEAAAKLYNSLHELDLLNLDFIIAERVPDIGVGKAINDRLERATKS